MIKIRIESEILCFRFRNIKPIIDKMVINNPILIVFSVSRFHINLCPKIIGEIDAFKNSILEIHFG